MESVFCSENISFVKVSKDLISEYLEMMNDIDGVVRYIMLDRKTPYSYEEELAFITEKIEEQAIIFSMIEKKSGDFIGNIELMDVKDGCGELGIAITTKKQDRHYGREAIRRMTDYGFQELGLKRIFLKVYPYNERAIHVYETCGFVKYDSNDKEIFMELTPPNEN